MKRTEVYNDLEKAGRQEVADVAKVIDTGKVMDTGNVMAAENVISTETGIDAQKEIMLTMAQKSGIEHAVWMQVKDLEFEHDLRKYCVQNLCGNYGKNYACPPDCGTPLQMEEKARKYQWALVLQNIYEMKDIMDGEEVRQIRKKHNQLTSQAIRAFRERNYKGLAIMAGPCAICKVCKKTEGEACPFPEQSVSCLSAYCIRAEKMAEHCGLTYWCGKNKVAFFSIYLI